jgi:hypothetical protein
MLREHDCDEIIETPIPKDVDANGNPIPMNARERQDFNQELRAYKEKDKIVYARIMKACRLNPKTKLFCESGTLKTANEILLRLRQRFHSVDETMKASHLLRYSTLKQQEGESGADFVDREQREYTALREMGINVDDSLRLTKCIQHDTTNSKYKSLAQTIFTTPNMTLSPATSLFETYHPMNSLLNPASYHLATPCSAGTVKKGHTIKSCMKKSKNAQNVQRNPHPEENDPANYEPSTKKRRYMCALCDLCDHPSHRCPRLPEVRQYLRELNIAFVITYLRIILKPLCCLLQIIQYQDFLNIY